MKEFSRNMNKMYAELNVAQQINSIRFIYCIFFWLMIIGSSHAH